MIRYLCRIGGFVTEEKCSLEIAQKSLNKIKQIQKRPNLSIEAFLFIWCPGPDLNRHSYSPADFESAASTDFATRADVGDYTQDNDERKRLKHKNFPFVFFFSTLIDFYAISRKL